MKKKGLFYIRTQNNSDELLWWRQHGNGYTTNLKEAWKVSLEQANYICASRPLEDFPLRASDVDRYAIRIVLEESLCYIQTDTTIKDNLKEFDLFQEYSLFLDKIWDGLKKIFIIIDYS